MDKYTAKQARLEIKAKNKQLKKVLSGYNKKRIAHICFVSLLYFVVFLLLSPSIIYFLNELFGPEKHEWVNDGNVWKLHCYQIIGSILLSTITISLLYNIKKMIIPNIGKQRNIQRVVGSLESEDTQLPVTKKEVLIERIIGHDAPPEIIAEIDSIIQNNTETIKAFIFNNEKTLLVEGKWGAGKTTYTLIALHESLQSDELKYTDYRFIYESAFKYVAEFNEFKKDILTIIDSILSEQNIFEPFIFSELINNLVSKKYGIPILNPRINLITTDIINNLNEAYEKRRRKKVHPPFRIVIIIDDVDRLLGNDIIQTLAFLSVIRRLKFIKIILPIDRDVIIDQLNKANVTDSQVYINKYLPDQSSTKIQSNYGIINSILSKKIRKEMNTYYEDEQIRPILECFYIKAFSERLQENMRRNRVDSLGNWAMNNSYPKELLSRDEYDSEYILDARDSLTKHLSGQDYSFLGPSNNFESLIYMLRYKDKRPRANSSFPLRVDEELYEKCIKSWVMPFTESKWIKLNLSIREANDMHNRYIKKIRESVTDKMLPHEIFVKAFNIVFPETPITNEMIDDKE